MTINPLAAQLNKAIVESNPHVESMLSPLGKKFFFPKGIITQSQEAKQKASRFNATMGIATEGGKPMNLSVVRKWVSPDLSEKEVFPYAPSSGVASLRSLWQAQQKKSNGNIVTSSLPVVTNALTHALSIFGDLFINPGETVLVPNMFWGNYKLVWGVAKQARIEEFSFFKDDLSGLNIDALDKALSSFIGDKVILSLNFPNNPTGYQLTEGEAEKVFAIIHKYAERGTNIVAICDDAYFGMFYEKGLYTQSLFGSLASLHKRVLAVKVDGCTKEAFMWGFRVGFITYGNSTLSQDAYQALEAKTAGAIRANISSVNHLGQTILSKVLQSEKFQEEQAEKAGLLRKRYERVKQVVYKDEYKGLWDVYPFNAGYFMCIRLKEVQSEDLRVHLLNKEGLGVIALGDRDIRIAFSSLEVDQIEEVFQSISRGVRDLMGG